MPNENYSYKQALKKNRVDVRLRESWLAGVNYMFYWVAKNSNWNSLLISMLKLKRFKIEERYTIRLFYISQKFKRGSLLPSIHVDTLKLKKRRVLKKRNNFSRAGNRKYLITAVKRWLIKRLLYREPKCDVDFCRLHGKFEVPKAKT